MATQHKHSLEWDDFMREWLPQERLEYLWDYGWARLSEKNLDDIVAFTRDTGILEVGGGSGHIAHQLREKGADEISFDIEDFHYEFTYQNNWQKYPHVDKVLKGDNSIRDPANHSRTLLTVWPHMPVCNVVEQNLDNFTKFIYVGELNTEDNGGICAKRKFFDALAENDFQLVAEVEDIDNFAWQYGKILFFEKGAPEEYEVPLLSYRDYYNREFNLGFDAAKYYMSVKKLPWYQFARCNLHGNKQTMKYLSKTKKHAEYIEGMITPELKEKFKKLIQECDDVIEELDDEEPDT